MQFTILKGHFTVEFVEDRGDKASVKQKKPFHYLDNEMALMK
jgi:hypothetical protein